MKIYKIAESPKLHNKRKRDSGDLYSWKSYVHTLFDKIWKYWDSDISRDEAYRLLSEHLGILESQAHMSKMGIDQLKQAAEWSKGAYEEMIKRREGTRHL